MRDCEYNVPGITEELLLLGEPNLICRIPKEECPYGKSTSIDWEGEEVMNSCLSRGQIRDDKSGSEVPITETYSN
jgi:hypothetical protein|tara:strand:- start:1972 stop:2196 length:225 start_codon:yes stop_codon:yes gene_type:complete